MTHRVSGVPFKNPLPPKAFSGMMHHRHHVGKSVRFRLGGLNLALSVMTLGEIGHMILHNAWSEPVDKMPIM